MSLLALEAINVRFGGLAALDDVSFEVRKGDVHGLIGPNGAGKTTLFNVISGVVRQNSGSLALAGHRFENLTMWQRTHLGLARTFQNIRLFTDMSVLENVMTGAHSRIKLSALDCLLHTARFHDSENRLKQRAHHWLDFVGLDHAAHQRAGDLSYGDQRRIEIARALIAEPDVLMLDEPAAGLNPAETQALAGLIAKMKAQGLTLLLVEHDMPLVMRLCDTITVLNFGRMIAQGTGQDIRSHRAVIEAYLGAKIAASLAPHTAAPSGGHP
jgi:branched-chain amino acid transport system ATP-binding protein